MMSIRSPHTIINPCLDYSFSAKYWLMSSVRLKAWSLMQGTLSCNKNDCVSTTMMRSPRRRSIKPDLMYLCFLTSYPKVNEKPGKLRIPRAQAGSLGTFKPHASVAPEYQVKCCRANPLLGRWGCCVCQNSYRPYLMLTFDNLYVKTNYTFIYYISKYKCVSNQY
jgi:hypothetical protein